MNPLPPLIPLLTFFIFWGIFYKAQNNWRSAFLSAAILWGILLSVITEVLTLFKAVSFWPMLGIWSLCLVAAILGWIKIVGNPETLVRKFKRPNLSRLEVFLLGSIVLIAATIGLTAWVAPPNTWDSMTYHMARVMHWIQDQSVAYYSTHIIRQLFMNPGSEFIMLHFQVLSGTDRLANSIQWFSLAGCAIGISLIAERLGADQRGQVFAAVVSITVPIGILEGSSTQNDLVLAFWLVCLVHSLLVLKSDANALNALPAGASLGLAILTKATAYIFAFPLLLWIGWEVLNQQFIHRARYLGIIVILAVLLNLGQYLRNISLFGNPLGLTEDVFSTGGQSLSFKYSNDVFSLPVLISNAIRNIAINIGTPFDAVNQLMSQGVDRLHVSLGISPNDPRTTWPGQDFQILAPSFQEESAGNPQDVLLILFSMIVLIIQPFKKRETFIYTSVLMMAFLLFSAYLKWQPWNSRLELPLFILWSAVIGITFAHFPRKQLANAIIILSMASSLPWVFLNNARPLIGEPNIFTTPRSELYFKNNHSLWYIYPRVAQYLGYFQCKQIGLYFDGGSWEYPLWVQLQQELGKDVRIESVNVENISAKEYHDFPEFTPCAVLVANPLPIDNFKVNNTSYSLSLSTKFISVLMQK